jgi:hypothetical protein
LQCYLTGGLDALSPGCHDGLAQFLESAGQQSSAVVCCSKGSCALLVSFLNGLQMPCMELTLLLSFGFLCRIVADMSSGYASMYDSKKFKRQQWIERQAEMSEVG